MNINTQLNKRQNLNIYGFYRLFNYKETSNKYAEYAYHINNGFGLQYNLNLYTGNIQHILSIGADFAAQTIKIHKFKSLPIKNRIDKLNDENLESDTLLANENILQKSNVIYMAYTMQLNNFTLVANCSYDKRFNGLIEKNKIENPLTSIYFSNVSYRLGASYYTPIRLTLYTNFSQGFMPPTTEELAANPFGYSGFNTNLKPAYANSYEIGMRGNLLNRIFYDLTAFLMNTKNDFFRFKQHNRGNQEVFYGNAGNSKRLGIELFTNIDITKNLTVQTAYTFSDFRYTSASIDPIYIDTTYILTYPPAAGQYLPNSPKHRLYAELNYELKHWNFNIATIYTSDWVIYTDRRIYKGDLDPKIYRNIQPGYNLYNASISYNFELKKLNVQIALAARNITNVKYIAFTEPDYDGNAYHPGTAREVLAKIKIKF